LTRKKKEGRITLIKMTRELLSKSIKVYLPLGVPEKCHLVSLQKKEGTLLSGSIPVEITSLIGDLILDHCSYKECTVKGQCPRYRDSR